MSVSSCARLISEQYGVAIRPRDVSLCFYHRELRDDLAPIEAGRRNIDPSLIPMVAMALRRRGKLSAA